VQPLVSRPTDVPAAPRIFTYALFATALLSIGLIGAAFLTQERIGINLGDEGFLWYGVQRVLAGEAPVRDFDAYEPGRYYWDAAWAVALGSDGLIQLRLANAAFAAGGLFLALLCVRRVVRSWLLLTLFGAILVLWLYPRHKLFEHGIAMAGVFIATELIRRPTIWRHALAGTFVGASTFFGRNHGLYMGVSLGLLAVYVYFRVDRKDARRRTAAFAAGLMLGLLPLVSMFIFAPGYWHAMVESVVMMVQGTQRQQALAVPWPWRSSGAPMAGSEAAWRIGTGLGFLLMPALLCGVLVWATVMRKSDIKERALMIGAAFVGITYTHHAFSRADFPHLAQAMHPVLLCAIGSIAVAIGSRKRWLTAAVALALIALTAATAMYAMPLAEYLRLPREDRTTLQIDGQVFRVSTSQKLLLTTLRREVGLYVKSGESFTAAPLYPFAYPFMHARSPWWDTYLLFARDQTWQQRMIQSMKDQHVSLVMLSADATIDGREDLKFPKTHPLVWQYIQTNYAAVEGPALLDNVKFWRLRSDIP